MNTWTIDTHDYRLNGMLSSNIRENSFGECKITQVKSDSQKRFALILRDNTSSNSYKSAGDVAQW